MADEEKIVLTLEANDEASAKLRNIARALENLDKESNNVGNNSASGVSKFVSSLESGISKVNNVTRHYNNAMSGLNRTVINSVRTMGSAIYDFTSESIDNFTKFSEQHARTLGAMAADYDNTARSQAKFFEDAQKLKDQAIQLGTYGINGTGSLMSITGVSQAQTELIKAGVSAKDITSTGSTITKDVLEFAQANELDNATAVEFAVTLGNQFGVDKKDWGSMLDKISHTADMSIIDVKDIVSAMKYAGGITSGLDRDLEETLGMISILGDFGLKGSQGGSGIQALMTRLLTGDTTVITDAQKEVAPGNALEKFYEFEKLAKPDGNLLPMADVIDQMDSIMAEMTDEEQAWFAKKLFGLYQMKSAYALLNGDETDLNSVIKEIKEQSEGTNANKLEQLLSSQYGQLESLNNLWEGVKTDIGDRLSPFVDAVRDELFTFLSSDGNYEINFDNLKNALDESCDLIEEKYGSAIANAVRGIGDLTIDITQVGVEIAPELGSGLLEVFSSLFDGNIIGEGSVFENWGEMIDNMYSAVDGLPEELQNLGDAIVGTIDWFGKLIALNVASEIAELISSVLQILTIAGGAVINVAGAVVVNGNGTGTGTGTVNNDAGTSGSSTATSGVAGSSVANSSGILGSADDVANALNTSTDDVIKTFGDKSSYTLDDIANGFGTTTDDVLNVFPELDDLAKAGNAVDDIAKPGLLNGLKLSGFGKALGIFGTLWQINSTGWEAYNDFKNDDTKGGAEAITGGVSSLLGGAGGAILGSSLGPFGLIIGSILGSMGGDYLGRDIAGEVYDDFENADSDYGTWAAGIPIIGELFKKKGTISDQRVKASKESARKTQESKYGVKPSDFGLPEVFDDYYDGYTGEIPWDLIISDLQKAYDNPLTWGSKETQYGMNVDEAKNWKDSKEYKEYLSELGKKKEESQVSEEELDSKMLLIREGDSNYEKDKDISGYGYSVWTGTQEELDKYLEGKNFIGSGESHIGTASNPYMIEGMKEAVKEGVSAGIIESSQNSSTGGIGSFGMAGISKYMNSGLSNPLFDNAQNVDDKINLSPQFTVNAPNVNVDVHVDRDNNVEKQVTILNPHQTVTMDRWYSRVASQYGSTNK